MAVFQYKKFQVLLSADSHKTQGLQTGDIVRRQYMDGASIIYSLMCVLSYGVERKKNEAGLYQEQPYFIGALIDGEEPHQGEMLDFVRITNLFNVDRSGALYLTASDSDDPFMDVIDQIGRKASLSWPENIEADSFSDATSQYIVAGKECFEISYTTSEKDCHRILTATKTTSSEGYVGLSQQFYQFVQNPQRVLISYKVRANKSMLADCRLAYIDDLRVDAEWTEEITTAWQYKFKVVTVEYSGRHLRTFKLSMENLDEGDQIQISDFNIILLSSVSNFADASTMRIGKLDGIVDPVFGQLDGYGAYLQKLYATHGAHISGTLTAGDENGFGGTFYAGKIHRNCFRSSIDIDFVDNIRICDEDVINPTGIGHVYECGNSCTMVSQSNEWLREHLTERYCFSTWVYAKRQCQIGIQQNGMQVGTVQITPENTHKWYRIHTYFDLLKPESEEENMTISLLASYGRSVYDTISSNEKNPDEAKFYLSSPQLEKGDIATQYQATDNQLNYTDDYGAWFSKGGIGGTIQNPLLQLNFDGEGGIGTRSNSFLLGQDGSGHVAKGNIKWNDQGKVEFGKGVTLNWGNLDDQVQDDMTSRSVSIVGEDTFTILSGKDLNTADTSPASIDLAMNEMGMVSTSSMRQWYVQQHGEFVPIENANGSTFEVLPDSPLWDNESALTLKVVVQYNDTKQYSDTITIRKQFIAGYEVRLSSSNGQTFHNGTVNSVITANVFYQGKPVDIDYVLEHFNLVWTHYLKSDRDNEIPLDAVVGPANVLTVNHQITASETYRCELQESDCFDFTFPLTFS